MSLNSTPRRKDSNNTKEYTNNEIDMNILHNLNNIQIDENNTEFNNTFDFEHEKLVTYIKNRNYHI